MRLLIAFLLWCLLLVFCPPLAALALLALPFVLMSWLAWKLVAAVCGAAFALLKAVLYLPARLLGGRAAVSGA